MIPLEIELKFRVLLHQPVLQSLLRMGGVAMPIESHRDVYLRHPCRDFAKTGEAFRLRYVNDEVLVTYKGPKEAGLVKTRSEIELPLAHSTSEGWVAILLALGFIIVDEVVKTRTPFKVVLDGIEFQVVCDIVEKIGNFVEVESIVTDRGQVEFIQQKVTELAELLKLRDLERRSYLRQILELRDHAQSS